MTLEQLLADSIAATRENTAATQALTEAWKTLTGQAKVITDRVAAGKIESISAGGKTVVQIPKPESAPKIPAASTPTAPVTDTKTPEAVVAATPAQASPSDAPAPVTLELLSKAVTEAATRNRDGVIALLSRLGVKRASEVPKDQWPTVIGELESV